MEVPQEWEVKGEPEKMVSGVHHSHFKRTVLSFLDFWISKYYLILG